MAGELSGPGQSDTLDQLTQAGNLATLNDCQAPVLTWLYSLFTPVLGQPAGALLIQAMLMFFFPAIVLADANDRRIGIADMALTAAWGVFTVALVTITGQILKDVIEVGAILCLLALVEIRSTTHNPARLSWCALGLLALIDTLRPTSFLMLAVAASICALFAFGPRRKFFVSLLLIVVVSAGAFAFPNYVNRKVLGAKTRRAGNPLSFSTSQAFRAASGKTCLPNCRAGRATTCNGLGNATRPSAGTCSNGVTAPCPCPLAAAAAPRALAAIAGNMRSSTRPSYSGPVPPLRCGGGFKPFCIIPLAISGTAFPTRRCCSKIIGQSLIGGASDALNTPANADQISGAVSHGRDLNGMTHGIDMTRKIQMSEANISLVPFHWVGTRIFTRTISLATGFILCIATLLWSWRNRRLDRDIDATVILSSALGVGNVVMLMAFGVADDGRYLVPTLVCGIVSLLLTIRAEIKQHATFHSQRRDFSRRQFMRRFDSAPDQWQTCCND